MFGKVSPFDEHAPRRDPWAEFKHPLIAVRGLVKDELVSVDGRPGTVLFKDFSNGLCQQDQDLVIDAFSNGAQVVRLVPSR